MMMKPETKQTSGFLHPLTKNDRSYLQFRFNPAFFIEWHFLLVLFVVFPLRPLQIKPHIRECFDVRQQCLDKWMKLLLYAQ